MLATSSMSFMVTMPDLHMFNTVQLYCQPDKSAKTKGSYSPKMHFSCEILVSGHALASAKAASVLTYAFRLTTGNSASA